MTDAAALRQEAARALRLSQLIGDEKASEALSAHAADLLERAEAIKREPCLQRQKPQVLRGSPLSGNSGSSLRTKRSRHTERFVFRQCLQANPAPIPHAPGLPRQPHTLPPCPMPPCPHGAEAFRHKRAAAVGQLPSARHREPSHVTQREMKTRFRSRESRGLSAWAATGVPLRFQGSWPCSHKRQR